MRIVVGTVPSGKLAPPQQEILDPPLVYVHLRDLVQGTKDVYNCGAQALEIHPFLHPRKVIALQPVDSCSEAVQGISCACCLVRSKYNIGTVTSRTFVAFD